MLPRKIKIYSHHRHYLNVDLRTKTPFASKLAKFGLAIFDFLYFAGLAFLKILKFIKTAITAACFFSGQWLLTFFSKSSKTLKTDFAKTRKEFPGRLKLLGQLQFNRGFALFLAVAVMGALGIKGLGLIARALELKQNVMKIAAFGNSYLEQAKQATSENNVAQAQNRFALAYQTFNQGQKQLNESGQILNQLLGFLPQKQAADNLLKAASLVSSSGEDFTEVQKQLTGLSVSPAGITSLGNRTAEDLNDITGKLNTILSKINTAEQLVNSINLDVLPKDNQETIINLKGKLAASNLALSNFLEVLHLVENLVLGKKNLLIIFENNNELRAGGGFMGTYGSLKISDGAINKITVSSIYDLDGQLSQVIKPPEPILNVSGRWFMRDSNWFADFPTTAKKISNFYELEGGETPDEIVALTPNLIIDLLKITGPIYLPKYDVTLTPDNFIEQTQVLSSISDYMPTNSPKQILADLVPVLLEKLSKSDKNDWGQIIQALQNNLNNKQIAIYSRDANLESQLESFNWTGSLGNTDRDFLSVVTSNLSGTKTDLAVEQKIKLTTNIDDNGTVTNELEITRTNKHLDIPDNTNLSFVRVYVPFGSKLLSNLGFDSKTLSYPNSYDYQIDDDVLSLEKSSVKDVLTNTTIGQESGKTFFGNWMEVKGGDSRTVKLVYELPFKLEDIDRYSLMLRKQLGANNSDFNWTVNFSGRSVAWKNFDPNTLNTSSLNSDIILSKDYFLGLVLQKR